MSDKLAIRLKEIKDKGGLRRTATAGAVDLEARTVELSFSSEVEYERWFGIEVLSHDADAVDLSRLQNGAPLLWMHSWDDQRGVVESVRIDGDRVGRAVVRLSKSPAGEQLLQDIADKIITKVSVGYLVNGMKLTEERGDIDVYTVTSWQPYEISMVSVPADDTVGVGRSMQTPQEENEPQRSNNAPSINENPSARTNLTMEKITRDATGNLVRAKVDAEGKILEVLEVIERAGADAAAAQTRGADAERARVRAISELGKAYGQSEKAMQFIADGKSPEDFQRELLHDFAVQRSAKPLAEQEAEAGIGLTKKEVRQYSIMRAVRAMLPDATSADREAGKFELECSSAAAQRYGKTPKGIIIPGDVLMDRAFGTGAAGTSGNGAAAIATNLLAGSFIDILRKRAWVMKRARTMAGLVGNVDIPKQTATTQAYWVGEGGAPTAGTPGLDQITFTPKTVGAYTDITRRLMMQATPDAESIVRDDILKVMALEIDRVAIYGTGTEYQPKGLKNYTGVHAVSLATPGAPAYTEYVQMETLIALDNADVDNMSYAFNAAIRGKAKTTLQFPNVNGSQRIWEPGNTINGYETNVSNQIASGDVFFGNWNDLVVAMWGGLELRVDPYALSTSGGLRLIALQDLDVNLRRVESFTYAA
jgi:HK97 family phage major capsid protein/HK97 family phage prohead protease